jgi:hypothetical protein
VLVETNRGPNGVDGSQIAKVLALAGVFPSDLRRSRTLELAYAELTGGRTSNGG